MVESRLTGTNQDFLEQERKRIDEADNLLLLYLEQRVKLALRLLRWKENVGLDDDVTKRHERIKAVLKAQESRVLSPELIETVWDGIFERVLQLYNESSEPRG